MRVSLKKLEFEGLFSFKEKVTIDLDKDSITQLVGKNGAGKSSIGLVLEELLFNTNSKGLKKEEIVNRSSTAYWIQLSFCIGDDTYVLRKEAKSTAKLKLTKNGTDISGHTATQTYAYLKNELFSPMYPVLKSLMFQNLQSSMDFLLATDTERKNFLVALLCLEEYGVIKDKAKLRESALKKKIVEVTSTITATEKALSLITVCDEPLVEVEVPEPLVDLEAELSELLLNRLEYLNINKKAEARSQADRELARFISTKPTQSDKYKTDDISILPELVKEATLIEARRAAIKKEHQTLKAVRDTCPTCNQKLPEFDTSIPAKLEALRVEHSALKSELEALNARITEANSALAETKAIDTWEREYQLKQARLPEKVEKVDVADLEKKIQEMQSLISKRNNEIQKAKQHNMSVQASITANANNRLNKKKLEDSLVEPKELLPKLRDDYVVVDTLVEALSPKGVLSYVLENSLKSIQKYANKYLVDLTDGRFKISFKATESKLTVVINDKGNLVSIRALSTGEFNKVNAAVLLAIRKAMSLSSKITVNFLFVDELISVLDTYAKNIFIDILRKESGLNTFIVSHDWKDPLVPTLNIVMDDKGNSRILHG